MASRMLRSQSGTPSDYERAEQPREGRVTGKATDYTRAPMCQNDAEQPKVRLVARKTPDSHEGAG